MHFVESGVESVDIESQAVTLANGDVLGYDLLVIATGATLVPDETEGLTGPGWNEKVFTFYDLDGASGLEKALDDFEGGRVVVNVVDMPIKCPVAPLEFCFLADWYFHERGIRDQVELTLCDPPRRRLHEAACVRAARRHARRAGDSGRSPSSTPARSTVKRERSSASTNARSSSTWPLSFRCIPGPSTSATHPGLGDALDFVETDPHTLQSQAAPEVFVIGDAANLPASKAGSVSHFEGEVLVENIVRFLAGDELDASFDGHANCFIETGFDKALLIDFNYDQEPVDGHYPLPVGLPLLKESRLNHLGKLMFQWFYWHSLLPGRNIPGIGAAMPTAGKHLD